MIGVEEWLLAVHSRILMHSMIRAMNFFMIYCVDLLFNQKYDIDMNYANNIYITILNRVEYFIILLVLSE